MSSGRTIPCRTGCGAMTWSGRCQSCASRARTDRDPADQYGDDPITVALPCWTSPPLTQNQLRRAHYMVEAKAKRVALDEARWAIRAARLAPITGATITLHYRPGTRRIFDADGLAPTYKIAQDALVAEGIIPADDWRHIPAATIRIHPPANGLPGVMWLGINPLEEA